MALQNFGAAALSRRSLFRSGAYLAAGGALASMPLGRALLAHDVSQQWPSVAALVEEYVGSGKLPSMIASFGRGDQELHSVGRGNLAFGHPTEVGLDSLYRIYSQTKPITGMAAMMLIEDGLLTLDQPVADLIPSFADMRVLKQPDGPLDDTVAADKLITIRHLLTHTAGLGYDITSKGPLLKQFHDLGITSGQISRFAIPGLPMVESAVGLEDWTERLASLPLIAQPGTMWSYSASIDLLGRVIEIASGKSFDAFLQERLFAPCGMSSTFFQVPESEAGRLTTNYGMLAGNPLPVDMGRSSIYLEKPPLIWGGSGLVCSPRDYDQFQKMLVNRGVINGNQVMSEDTVRVGTSNILPEGVDLSGSWMEGQGMGAGGRSVGTTYGWGGAAGTMFTVDMASRLRTGLYVQYLPSESFPIRDAFIAAVLKDAQALVDA